MEPAVPRKPALGFIFITLVLVMLGVGIIIPVLPALVTQFKGGDIAESSGSFGLLMGAFGAMQFIASPILGSLSDRFGRRKVILVALSGTAVDYVIMGWAPTLGWLFLGRLISGATAGVLAACNAYVADVTPPDKRAQGYGIIGAAIGVGFVVGPSIGGLLGNHNPRLPFFAAAACVAVNVIYGAFVLPESLMPENRRPFSWKRANPVGSILALRRFRGVLDLAWMYFLLMFGQSMLQTVWALYTTYRFEWTPRDVGLSLTCVGVTSAVIQGGLVKRIIAFTGERKGLVAGLIFSSIAMAGYGSATHGWMIYAIILVGAWGGITGPAAQALITTHVPPNEYGAVQGSLSGMSSLAYVFAPLVASWSFGKCIAANASWHVPGIAFYEASALTLLALVLALRSFKVDDRIGVTAQGLENFDA
jgi:MFS transporter, DHA1 family, tetracycline resistance protein